MLNILFAALLVLVPQSAADDAETERALLRRALPLLAERPMSAQMVGAYEDLHGRAWRLGDVETAHAALERIVPWLEQLHGPDVANLGTALDTLANLLRARGDYIAARPLYERGRANLEAALGPEHSRVAGSINNQAVLLRELGDYAAARPLFERALAIDEATLGPDHPDVAYILMNLGHLLYNLGEFEEAQPLYERSLAIREAAFGPEHATVADSLSSLATLLVARGDYAAARPMHERALAINEAALSPDDPVLALVLNNLAKLHSKLGDNAAAQPLYERALAIWEAALGPDHPKVAHSLNNLASMLKERGDYAAARPLYKRSLAIWEEALGPDHPHVASSLQNLASVNYKLGEYAAAQQLHERSLAIREAALGPEHPSAAISLEGLANLHHELGDYATARPLYERSLAILLAAYGHEHADVARGVQSRVLLELDDGQLERALPYAERLADDRVHVRRTMASLTTGESHLFLAKQRRARNALLSVAAAADDPAAAYATVLDSKGQVARLTLQTRAQLRDALDPEILALMESLAQVQGQLSRLALQTDIPDRERHGRQLDSLRTERDGLDRELRRKVDVTEKVAVTVQDVANSLPPESLLVDLLVHESWVAAAHDGGVFVREGHWSEPRVSAWVVRSGANEVQHVDLGPAAAIEEAVASFLGDLVAVGGGTAPEQRGGSLGRAPDAQQGGVQRTLRALVWDPLAVHLDGVETVFMSPDGVLGTLPFETLQDASGRYLVEDLAFVYVSSGGALVRHGSAASPLGASLLVAGGVDYDRGQDSSPSLVSPGGSDLSRGFAGSWSSLPATVAEASSIVATHAGARQSGSRHLVRGSDATEGRLKLEMPQHAILHLATHGYFQPEGLPSMWEAALDAVGGVGGERGMKVSESSKRLTGLHPGLLSGLVFAGANSPPDEDEDRDDGYLTASEVTLLDLSHVDLVVLSACETGLGRPQSGEGLLGLRRSFHMAGADTVISSLWSVQDESTSELMQGFYTNLLVDGMGRHEALRTAQLSMLAENRERHAGGIPSTWGAFVLSGEWR